MKIRKKAHWIFTERQGTTVTIKQHLFNGYNVAKETRDLYFEMQNLNRATIKYAADIIKVRMNLSDIKTLCENYLLEHGADSFWYWDVGAFVFAGDETAVSISGKDYKVLEEQTSKIFLTIVQVYLLSQSAGYTRQRWLYQHCCGTYCILHI